MRIYSEKSPSAFSRICSLSGHCAAWLRLILGLPFLLTCVRMRQLVTSFMATCSARSAFLPGFGMAKKSMTIKRTATTIQILALALIVHPCSFLHESGLDRARHWFQTSVLARPDYRAGYPPAAPRCRWVLRCEWERSTP